jgi:DNA replication and repair protein RecF
LSSLALCALAVRSLRNLRQVDFEPSAGVNLICGDNGQGKTTLLESIYLVATSRSFRTRRLREMISHGQAACSVRATLQRAQVVREQFVAVGVSQRVLKADGQKVSNVAHYAVCTPVVAFHPAELQLTVGPASARRTLMDRVALYLDPASYEHAVAYQRAMGARTRLLQSGPDNRALEAYEQLMALHGVRLTSARRVACDALLSGALDALQQLAPDTLQLAGRYIAAGGEDQEQALQQLRAGRERDARRSCPGFGPHRDELRLEIDGRPARIVASQGQHRVLTLALKLAELRCITQATGVEPLLLLDDVSSELDESRTEALFKLLAAANNQVFVTTTRPEILLNRTQWSDGMRVFEMRGGAVRLRLGS